MSNTTEKNTEALLKERGKSYGDPIVNHTRIAEAWSAILDHEVQAAEVALCMMALKLIRASTDPEKADNMDDVRGYAAIHDMIVGGVPVIDLDEEQ